MSANDVSVNFALAVGPVVSVVHTERADQLIVADNSSQQYPTTVACEFYGERVRKMLEGIEPGQLVRVQGVNRSREYNGKWYTTFNALGLTRLGADGRWGKEETPAVPIPF
jgi:hypothetical protein